MKKYWFKAKTYGWGWYPATIEGWICIATYLIVITSSSLVIEQFTTSDAEFSLIFSFWITLCTAILVFISYKKGEKPGWSWGNKTQRD